MKIKKNIQNIIKSVIVHALYPECRNEEIYLDTLRKKYHVDIGEHCKFWDPISTYIDTQRPHMLHVGDYVRFSRNVTVLCHDFSRSVLAGMENGVNIGEAKMTSIGNNVFFGMNVTVLMGSVIGDNSIVGAGSVVHGDFPDGVVIAGNPAKVICTIQQYREKLEKRELESARLMASEWKRKTGIFPTIEEMTDAFAWLYLPHAAETVEKHPGLFRFSGVDRERLIENFINTEPVYNSFEEFLEEIETEESINTY